MKEKLDNGYSLDFSPFHTEEDESFDVMIQYGGDDTYDVMREGYQRTEVPLEWLVFMGMESWVVM